MKQVLKLFFALILTTFILFGCSTGQTSAPQKSEEELKAEIKAEVEEEIRREAEAEQKANELADNEQTQKPDEVSNEKNDLSKGYTYKLENDVLKLTYNNTGNTVTLVEPKESNDPKKFIKNILSVNRSYDGTRLYFEIPAFATTNAIHYVDLQTFEVKYFTDGWFIRNVGEYPYDLSVIIKKTHIEDDKGRVAHYYAYSSAGDQLCELGDKLEENLVSQIMTATEMQVIEEETNIGGSFNLQGFTDENINETQVNYNEYVGVIVPMYNGVNKDKLTSQTKTIGPSDSYEVNFAVFGKLQELVITYQESMFADPITLEVGTVENVIMTVKTEFPFDMGHVGITGIITGGEGYRNEVVFGLDDMRDLSEYKPIMVKW